MNLIPNLICCNKKVIAEATDGVPAQTKLEFAPGRLVAALLTAGVGVFVGFLPDAKKKKDKNASISLDSEAKIASLE